MAVYSSTNALKESKPKKTRQGNGNHSKYSATSRNSARKKYRGQGKITAVSRKEALFLWENQYK